MYVIHMAHHLSPEGYARGLLCARASMQYAWSGRAANTSHPEQVTCKRCLHKLTTPKEEKHTDIENL